MRTAGLLFVILSSFTSHANTICSGRVAVENPVTKAPMFREVIVEINGCEKELSRNKNARVSIQIVGGGPMVYRGLLFTDGSREQRLPPSGSGDVTRFRVTHLPGEQILFELNMLDSQMEIFSAIKPTVLDCE